LPASEIGAGDNKNRVAQALLPALASSWWQRHRQECRWHARTSYPVFHV